MSFNYTNDEIGADNNACITGNVQTSGTATQANERKTIAPSTHPNQRNVLFL